MGGTRFDVEVSGANLQRNKQYMTGWNAPGAAGSSMADGSSQPQKADVSYPRMRQDWR
jgi:hypothetical protein